MKKRNGSVIRYFNWPAFDAIGLITPFDPIVSMVIKAALSPYHRIRQPAGGWKAGHGCWWLKAEAWPEVGAKLTAMGCVLEPCEPPASVRQAAERDRRGKRVRPA